MLSLINFVLKSCWLCISNSAYKLREIRKRIRAGFARKQLQLAHLRNLSRHLKDEQDEILMKYDINYPYCEISLEPYPYEGYTCLHFAVENEDLEFTKKLLYLGADLLKQEGTTNQTPLHIAYSKMYIEKNYLEGKQPESALVNTLLTEQVNKKEFGNPSCNLGLNHLHIASAVNHKEAVKFLTDNGNSVNEFDYSKCTPLHFAVKYSATEVVEILLNHQADIHRQNAEGVSPLHLLMNRLLDVHDFVKIGKRTQIAPYKSEMERLENIAKLFLVNRISNIDIDHISNVTWKISRAHYYHFIDDTGLSAIHLACMLPNTSPTKYFLNHYDSVNLSVNNDSKSWPGWTPLHFAACCNTETFKLLLEEGADLTIKNAKGEFASDLLLQRFNPDIVSSMLLMKDELSSIKLSDNHTTLSDFLLASSNIVKFRTLLHYSSDVNINISLDSPYWPGYTILHLVILMNQKTKTWEEFQKKTDFQQSYLESLTEAYNCTKEEEKIYMKRIKMCLKKGYSVTTKNAKGQTPLDLAFKMHKENVVDKFLERCQDNESDSEGLSHFHIACAAGKLEVVKQLVKKGVDINCPAESTFQWYNDSTLVEVKGNSTPLHIAVTFKHIKIVSLLLEKNADVYAKDFNDSTPIHLSMKLNLRNIAQLLLEKTPNLQESLDKDKTSHLQVAVYADNEAAVMSLMNNTSSLLTLDKKTLQSLALNSKSGKTYRQLLKVSNTNEEIDFDSIDVWQPIAWSLIRKLKREKWRDPKAFLDSKSKMTLLHLACAKFDIKWVKKLLRRGADVNAKIRSGTFAGQTSLYRLVDEAAKQTTAPRNLTNLLELLIQKGADVTISNEGQTPVHRLSYLLNDHVNLQNHQQAFMLPIFDMMLRNQKRYDVNPIDSQGFTHFHYACARNLVDVVQKFLDNNVDVNRVTKVFSSFTAGFTPLHFALACRSEEVTELLLEQEVKINAKDALGNTPLHMAIKGGFINFSLLKSLLKCGAETKSTTLMNETPLECLLKLIDYNFKHVDLLFKYKCSLKYVNNDFHELGILGCALVNARPHNRQGIVKRLIQNSGELKKAIDGGFNAVLSTVKAPTHRRLIVNDYLDVFEQLINIGCDIDQKGKDGLTALHVAIFHLNVEAIQALLQLGVDLGDCRIPVFPRTLNIGDIPRFYDFKTSLETHIWKMKFLGFDENEWNNSINIERVGHYLSDNNVDQSCQSEMVKMEETLITQNLNVKSFLSELKGVAEYPQLPFHRRYLVDEFFKKASKLRREFPQLCGWLSYRYKQALVRMKLWKPAKEAFVSIDPFFLPDLCVDNILKYLKNDELNVLIESTEENN